MKARFTNIEAVTFDFYNTLVYHRTGRGRGATLMEYLREQGLESDPWEHQILYDVFQQHGVEYTTGLSEQEKLRYFRRFSERVFQRLEVRAADGAAANHATNLWNILGPASLAPFPEVHEVLHLLSAKGFPLAVVSNWQCGLKHFCTELGLGRSLDHVLASAEVGSAKPDPGIFLEACRRLQVPPRRVLHIGDSLVDDLEGGRGAGLQVVLIRREPDATEGYAPTIPDLKAIPGLLGLA